MSFRTTSLAAVIFLFVISGKFTAQTPQNENQPTLDETSNWLQENLPLKTSTVENSGSLTFRSSVADVQISNCTCKFTLISSSESSPFDKRTTALQYDFLAKVINKNGISISSDEKKAPPVHYLFFATVDKKLLVKRQTFKNGIKSSDEVIEGFNLQFDSLETAKRFQKAFSHYVNLCQLASEKKEPF